MRHPLQSIDEQADEKRILVVYRHGFLFFRYVITLVLLAALAVIALTIVQPIRGAVADRAPEGVLLVMGLSAFLLVLGVLFLNAWVGYYLDVWIVSTKRIVNIEQKGLFSRVVSELHIEDVEDVTVEVQGVMQTMLHFGDVYIQTASENPHFHFDNIPKPYEVAEKIMDLRRAMQKSPQRADAGSSEKDAEVPTFPG